MGCLCDKSEWETYEEYIEKSLDRSLLSSKNCENIIKSIHRTTLHFHLTKSQLSETLAYLKLTLSDDLEKILNHFLELPRECKFIKIQGLKSEYGKNYGTLMYSVKKLSAFGILLGEGNTEEKAKCLFSVYDIDASNNLSKWEISVMINDIMDIVLKKIPDITVEFFPELFENLQDYKEKLNSVRSNYVNLFKYLLLEDNKKEMTSEEFILGMKKVDMRLILNNKVLRLMMINNFQKCSKMFSEIKKEVNDYQIKTNPGKEEDMTGSEEFIKP
jgi:hypothetical protein